jgi:hypothetical protein
MPVEVRRDRYLSVLPVSEEGLDTGLKPDIIDSEFGEGRDESAEGVSLSRTARSFEEYVDSGEERGFTFWARRWGLWKVQSLGLGIHSDFLLLRIWLRGRVRWEWTGGDSEAFHSDKCQACVCSLGG